MASEQRETLGSLLQNKGFQVQLISLGVFFVVCIILNCGNFWYQLYNYSMWSVSGLIIANHLGAIAWIDIIVSWILIDQISWLAKTLIFLPVGLLFIICGTYLAVYLFSMRAPEQDLNSSLYRFYLTFNEFDIYYENSFLNSTDTYHTLWIPVFVCLNLFQGVFCLIFSYYLCAIMDGTGVASS